MLFLIKFKSLRLVVKLICLRSFSVSESQRFGLIKGESSVICNFLLKSARLLMVLNIFLIKKDFAFIFLVI